MRWFVYSTVTNVAAYSILVIYFIKTASRVPHVECFEGDWFSNSKVQSLIADYLIIANVAKTVTQPTQLQSMF